MSAMRHARPSETRKRIAIGAAMTATGGIALPLVSATTANSATVSTWDRVAACESTGNWSINTGNTFYGGLQFTLPSWAAAGGTKYASRPDLASKHDQILTAEVLLKLQGPGAWPVCGPRAGLARGGPDPYSPAALAPKVVPKPSPKPADVPATYVVKSGDWLSTIARVQMGAVGKWKELYAANVGVIGSDPNRIFPGQKLAIPGRHSSATEPKSPAPSADYVKPCDGPVTQSFGNPSAGYALGWHTGTDFGCTRGTPVRAAAAGVVVGSDTSSAYGTNVQIRHADGKYTLYAHLSSKSATVGQKLSAGTVIGTVGNSGTHSSGPHLHLELRIAPVFAAGNFLNPVTWLRSHGVTV